MKQLNDRNMETHKDSLQVPETCKENQDSFTSLEEAAEEYAYKGIPEGMKVELKPIADEIIKNFIAGASWMREQMMKEAVDYKICNNLAAYPVIYYEVDHLGLKYGDKVKLIIVKE